MNILHIIQTNQYRGVEIFTRNLAGWQIEQGHSVDVVTVYSAGNQKQLEFPGSSVYSLDASGSLFDYKAFKKLNSIITRKPYDIVQANSGDTFRYSVFSKWLFKWKPPIIFRNSSVMGDYLKNALLKKYFYSVLRKACAGVASVSEKSKMDFLETFPKYDGIIETIPVGIDLDLLPDLKTGSSGDRFQIVHVGGFSFEKNHFGLIRIFNEVRKRLPQAELHLLGDGKLRDKIEGFVQSFNLQDAVIFHGYVANPLDYIANADLLVLPSIIEGLPSVILEAFALKIPVIAYNVGGIPELVKDGITGRLINKGDEVAFAETILKTFATPDNDLTLAAQVMVKTHFNKDIIVDLFDAFYRKVYEKSPPN